MDFDRIKVIGIARWRYVYLGVDIQPSLYPCAEGELGRFHMCPGIQFMESLGHLLRNFLPGLAVEGAPGLPANWGRAKKT